MAILAGLAIVATLLTAAPHDGLVGRSAASLSMGATAASAHTSGGSAVGGGQWHPWPSDGCSWVPNQILGVFNFTHACQHHDGCYRGNWASRSTCDWWFHNDMRASCETGHTWWFNRSLCRHWAWLYYQGVRVAGHAAYLARSIYARLDAYV